MSRARSATAVRAATCPLLWIDDDVHQDDPSVRLLTIEGFRVDCATLGEVGLTLARAREYGSIILDLRLPDCHGLQVLEQLRVASISTSVLVLTGHGDVGSAVSAMKLGAVDFRIKPLIGDELIKAVRATVDGGTRASNGPRAVSQESRSTPPAESESDALTRLVDALDALDVHRVCDGVDSFDSGPGVVVGTAVQDHLMRVLVRATLGPSLSTGAFLECAQALRHAVTHATDAEIVRLVTDVRRFIERAVRVQTAADDPRVRATIVMLEQSLRNGVRATERDLAALLGIASADVGRLLRDHTGLRFKFCRLVLAVRLAAHELSASDEHIAQIAYRLGYEHASQLDRDFHRIFNISPRHFRKLARRSFRARRRECQERERECQE